MQTKVVIEGYLKLSSSTHCEEQCNLFLLDYLNSENTLVIFITLNRGEGTAQPNQMEKLPADYWDLDLDVRLDNGERVSGYSPVRLTGNVCRTTTDKPCLEVTRIEPARNAPATATPEPQEPTPFPADYANIQALKDDCLKLAEKNQLGRISGTLHVPEDVYCNKSRFGRTCSIYLQDSSGETLYFDAWEIVHFDPIPEKYTSASIHLRAEDDQSIPEGGKVTILMSVSNLLDPNQCLYYPYEINLQP